MDANQDHILACAHDIGDVELLHQPAALANPDLDAVQPHAVDRFDTVETKQHPLGRPVRQLEAAAMITGRVFIGNMWWVDRERIANIGINWPFVRAFRRLRRSTGQHPMRRHRNGVPGRIIEIGIRGGIVKLIRLW